MGFLLLGISFPWWYYPLAISSAALFVTTFRLLINKLTRTPPTNSSVATVLYLAVGFLPAVTYIAEGLPSFREPPIWLGSALWLLAVSSAGAYLVGCQNQ